jgi:hypothetical protein
MVPRIVSIDAVGDAPSHVSTNAEQARPRTARQVASAPAPTQPHIRARMMEARHVRVMTTAVRSPVRPATLWIRVVSSASARVIAGRRVVSRRASLDVPGTAAPRLKTRWSTRASGTVCAGLRVYRSACLDEGQIGPYAHMVGGPQRRVCGTGDVETHPAGTHGQGARHPDVIDTPIESGPIGM